MSFRNRVCLWALASVGFAGVATSEAATITIEPHDTVGAGNVVAMTIVGRGFTEGSGGTLGGGVSVSWDPAMLSLESYATTVFTGDQFLASAGTTTVLDNPAGELRNLSVASLLDGVTVTDFDIAALVFKGLTPGVAAISLAIGQFDSGFDIIWTDSAGLTDVAPFFVGSSLTVVPVPVPAALPMMLGALGMLAAARRRREATSRG